jgi:hypothetical protein
MANTHPQGSGENGFKSIYITPFSGKQKHTNTLNERIHLKKK